MKKKKGNWMKKRRSTYWLMDGEVECWKCRDRYRAVSIMSVMASGDDDVPVVLSYVTKVPNSLLKYVQARFPWYQMRHVKKEDKFYYVNVCPSCNMLTGDYHLYSKRGAIFNPSSEAAARDINLRNTGILIGGMDRISGKHNDLAARLIFESAVHIKDEGVAKSVVSECPGCSSASVTKRSSWLCYRYPVLVCGDCEWTGSVDGNQIHPGSFAVYDDEAPFPTPEEEAEFLGPI